MKSDVPDRGLVREYLLGRLDDKKELEEQLSHEICVNDDLSEMVESIDEEIIEDFLDGGLDPADKDAVDGYFLRPPERKEKLRFARILRHHLEQRQDLANAPRETFGSANVRPEGIDYRSPHFGHSHLRNYGELAALVVLVVAGVIYISGIRKNQARLEGQLAQEREQSATVTKVAQVSQASMVALTLVSDRSRGDSTQIPNIEIKPSAQRIVVEIALPGRSPGPFDVMLEARGKNQPIWAARLLPLVSASGDARLVFDIPAQGVISDVYSFVVSSSLLGSGRPKHYDFRITVTN
jgi:anti-sigma factor RsiW